MDMGSMDSTSSSSSSSMPTTMAMVFANGYHTPLYSNKWTPQSASSYAGTCIFLIVLAVLSRLVFAWTHALEVRWNDRSIELNRALRVGGVSYVTDKDKDAENPSSDKHPEARSTAQGVEEGVRVLRLSSSNTPSAVAPWRFTVDLPRACIYMIHAGISYLLMLAAMTMNVEYFFSILGGFFLGESVVGRFVVLGVEAH